MRAASLMILGESNMGKVANSVGYEAECKFAEAFRKEFGCRPKHFARRYSEEREQIPDKKETKIVSLA